jgi:large-conductance mechanosensitive channel
MNDIYKPRLVEYNIKSLMKYSLSQCHDIKVKYYSFIFNLVSFLILGIVIGSILYFKYKGHSKEECERRENEKRNYVLYNLRKFQNIKNSHITNIPQSNEY